MTVEPNAKVDGGVVNEIVLDSAVIWKFAAT